MQAKPSASPIRITVPDSHPALAGHFPGRPIVPGALLLSLIAAQLSERVGQPLCATSKLRFHQPLLPDQQVLVQFEQKAQGQWRFRGAVDGQTVIKGILHGSSAALDAGK